MTTVPHISPVNSEDFLPPATCKHKTGTDDFIKEQNADRERTVCAIGLDIHYELGVTSSEAGAFEPRMKPFNPRMSGPACPYNYTGKFVSEAEHVRFSDDPIALGRKIESTAPYDTLLYAQRDPRKLSKTVVVRDYGCKIPIDIADTEKIAKAVLNHYPDQYVDFLKDFVSNMFGASMRKFLDIQQSGLQKLIDNPAELNRVSWGAYITVQGGNTPEDARGTDRKHQKTDKTLNWSQAMSGALGQLSREGGSMTAHTSAQDVYDLRPCLKQHIETLNTMKTQFCRGFGTKEQHVLTMLWYVNEQGRKLCNDLGLMAEDDVPDYNKIELLIPYSFYHTDTQSVKTRDIPDPDMNASIRAPLQEVARDVRSTLAYRYPMGEWTGSSDSLYTFLNVANAGKYSWGWGHCANMVLNVSADEREKLGFFAPFHQYTIKLNAGLEIANRNASKTFVKESRWGSGLATHTDLDKVMEPSKAKMKQSLRASLQDTPNFDPYRGTEPYGKVLRENWDVQNQFPLSSKPPTFTALETPPHDFEPVAECGDKYTLVNRKYVNACKPVDPYVKMGCLKPSSTSENIMFPAEIFGPYLFTDMRGNDAIRNLVEDGNIIISSGDTSGLPFDAKGEALVSKLASLINHDAKLPVTPKDKEAKIKIIEAGYTLWVQELQGSKDPAKLCTIFKQRFMGVVMENSTPHLSIQTASQRMDKIGNSYGPDKVWPYRTMLGNYKKDLSTDNKLGHYLPALSLPSTSTCFQSPSDSSMIDVRSMKDTLTSFNFESVSSEVQKVRMKILSFRIVVQNTLGMLAAAVVCSNPMNFDEHNDVTLNGPADDPVQYPRGGFFEHEMFTTGFCKLAHDREKRKASGESFWETVENTWKRDSGSTFQLKWNASKHCFELKDDKRVLLELERTKVYLEGILKIIIKNFNLIIDKDKATVKERVKRVFMNLRREEKNKDKYTLENTPDSLPSELYLQGHGHPDPRLLYSATIGDFKRQRDNEEPLLANVLKPSGNISEHDSAAMKVAEHVIETVHNDLKECSNIASMVKDTFTEDDSTAYKGSTYRAAVTPTPSNQFPEPADTNDRVKDYINSDNPADIKGIGDRMTILKINRGKYGPEIKSLKDEIYNYTPGRPQAFAMFDAAGLLWHAREFFNPADCNRPTDSQYGDCPDSMHYWSRTLVETFVVGRQNCLRDYPTETFEENVRKNPQKTLPSKLIGSMCDESFQRYFPLLPNNHPIRDDLRKIRALDVLWGTLPSMSSSSLSTGSGAWMPLSVSHQVRLMKTVDLFDTKYNVPHNPWLAHNGFGCSRVYNQSYHSVYHTDSYRAPHFREWYTNACRYQAPSMKDGHCTYPFSQYGGTPVEADFVHHRVDKPNPGSENRTKQLIYNRFGFTGFLRIGKQFHDTGLLQDMYQFEYRPYADLSRQQRAMPQAESVYPSNFLAYARTHAIIALASCNHGTEDASDTRVVRNLYRLYVDTHQCMGANPDDDGVPVVMGFLPSAVNTKEDRPVILYAGSLSCLNTKLDRFCASDVNRGGRVCQLYKQVYLNDAALLFTRLLRAERRRILHHNNFRRAMMKRGPQYDRRMFDTELMELQDAYIEFLQTTVLGMLIENGANLNNVPLHLLEPRELEVSMFEEDDNLVGNDYLTPRAKEIIKDMDFSGDNLSRTQLAILSLIPPNHRILGTLRLNQSTEIIDLEHAKKQIQRETIKSNKNVWQRYSEALISGAFAQKLLEVEGPLDFSFDMSAIKDPLKESENIRTKMSTTNSQASSSLSQTAHGTQLRQQRGPDSILAMNSLEMERALQAVRERIERDYAKQGGMMPRVKCLAMLKVPEHVKRMLRPEYENGSVRY